MATVAGAAPLLPNVSVPATGIHPVVFLVLFLPFGIPTGFITVTLAYLLSHAGISVMAIAGLAALHLLPQNLRFLWAPIVDTMLTSKRWFVLGAVAIGAVIVTATLVPMVPANLAIFQVLVLTLATVTSFNGMAAHALMAHATTPDEKGRAGGWSQAGNLGGAGLGGGAGLWVATHVHQAWVSGALLGLACMACCAALLWVNEPAGKHRAGTYWKSVAQVGRECWELLSSRLGFLALFIMLVPIGSGGAINLWAAIAGDWRAGADTVALVSGVLSGVASIAGAVVGGFICDWMDRKKAYCMLGLVIVAVTLAMAVSPRTRAMFVAFTLVYAFALGMCWAAFGAVTLEAIGAGAAATKYNIIAGLSNLPLLYEALIDGWAQTRFGSGGMLYVEALLGAAAVALYLLVAAITRGRFRHEKPCYEGV